MIIKCPIEHLNANPNRAYVDALTQQGVVSVGFLFIDIAKANSIRLQFNMEPKQCCSNKSKATLIDKIKNATKATGRVLKAVMKNEKLLNDTKESDRRFTICRQCEQFDKGRCSLCGCWIKFKTQLTTETGHCPKKLW